jgi:hypothetical protein
MRSPAFLSASILLLFACTSPVYSQNRFQYPEAHFSFDLPADWEMIPNEIVREYHNEMLKKTGATARVPDVAFKRKSARSPFDLPYFLVNLFEQDVDDSIIKEYLSSIPKSPRGEPGEPGQAAKGSSITAPVFDEKRRLITFSIDTSIGNEKQEIEITGHFAIFFFKEGVVTFNFYASKDTVSEYVSAFKGIIDSVIFDKGYEYKSGLFKDALIRKSAIVVGLLIALALLFRYIWVKKKTESNVSEKHKG